jgi:hypothetical protein
MNQRFISEFGLSMFADACVLLQEENLGADLLRYLGEDAPEFHIYVIGARPRITVVPGSWLFDDDQLLMVFRVDLGGGSHRDVEFETPQPTTRTLTRIESAWPHNSFALFAGDQKALAGKSAHLARGIPEMREFLDLEVLYIGQSFGAAGERQAQDRLQSHATLQKILGEASRLTPDREVWLTLFHFEEVLLMSFDGKIKGDDALAADEGRIERALGSRVSDQQKINFTEAALIRYFEPKHNTLFRENFPDPGHKTYRECYDIDLNMVAVELPTDGISARLYSSAREGVWRHFAMYPLHDPAERRYMLDVLGTRRDEA